MKHFVEEGENALFSSTATSSGYKNGHLLLTQERILLISKGKILSDIRFENIHSVEQHSNHMIGGIPYFRIIEKDSSDHRIGIWNSWNPFHLRDIWVCYIADMTAAWKMNIEIHESSTIMTALKNIILSSALTKRHGKLAPPGCFQYFSEAFPDKKWFSIPKILQHRGRILNIDSESDISSVNHVDFIVSMLQSAIQLIHMFRDANDNVDFKSMKESKEYKEFTTTTCDLQRVIFYFSFSSFVFCSCSTKPVKILFSL